MKSLIIALAAALSAPATITTTAAEPGHVMLVGMADPATEGPDSPASASATSAAISPVTYSVPPLPKRSLVPASLRKLDFHGAHPARQLDGQGFDWEPAAVGK
ncbi:hypothetical protein ABQJ48_26490 [Paraburkholderia sp. DGU8]